MNKQPEITRATRQAFIDAFCMIGRRKSVEKITIKEISDKAGYSRCTFYQYFEDIYDLRDYVERLVIDRVKENFQNGITCDNFTATFIDAFMTTQPEMALYFDLLLSPSCRAHFTENIIADVATSFMKKFNLPQDNPLSNCVIEIYFQTVLTGLGFWISRGRDLPIETISQLIGRILAEGVINARRNDQPT